MTRSAWMGLLALAGLMGLAGCDGGLGAPRGEAVSEPIYAADTAPGIRPGTGHDTGSDTGASTATSQAKPRATSRATSAIARTRFGQAVGRAVATNPEVAIAGADIASAQARLRSAQGAFRPAVSAGLDASATTTLGGDGETVRNFGPFVRVSQLIYDGGAARNARSAAAAEVTAAADDRLARAATLALDAVEAYVGVTRAAETLGLQRGNLARHREFLGLVQDRRDLGVAAETDRLAVRSRLADAQAATADAEAALAEAQARYAEVFGVPPSATAAPPPAPGLGSNTAAVIAASPRMRALDTQIVVAEARLAEARSARQPRVEIGGTARPVDDRAQVGLDLSVDYQFDTRGEAAAAIDRAEAQVARLNAEKARLTRDIKRALDVVRTNQSAGAKRVTAAAGAVRANRENVAAVRDEFSIGRATLLEVLDAQQNLVRAQERRVAASADRIVAGYEALSLTGDILPTFGIFLPEVTPGVTQ